LQDVRSYSEFLWGIAELLRGDFKRSQYGRVILPFTVLRRLECVLAPVKDRVLNKAGELGDVSEEIKEKQLCRVADLPFFNDSPLTLATLSDTQTRDDLYRYLNAFSKDARDIFEHFNFEDFIDLLDQSDLLYRVVREFAAADLSPAKVTNYEMGVIFEELIRRFAESSNETAGEHFTPRDVVHLVTALVFTEQEHKLEPHSIVTIYDPAAGTGGFLTEAESYIKQTTENVRPSLYGQELNPESYAICKADMLIKGHEVDNIKLGNTFSNDLLSGERFDFMLTNPPFGVDWSKVEKPVRDEHKQKGYQGRFGPGLPRKSDGSLLFLMHLMSKMRDPREGGSRIGIILNGSPLFTGGAGSGESEIRRHILENDLLEAIIGLPTEMFYNTGIATYIWVLNNNKPAERRGKVQLIDASQRFEKMRKSLGNKRSYMPEATQDEVVRLYHAFEDVNESKIFDNEDFGYRRITVEQPLRLNFQCSEDRIQRIPEAKPIAKLNEDQQAAIQDACRQIDAEWRYTDREEFLDDLKAVLEADGIKLTASQFKAVWSALSERDEEASVCRDKKGRPESDTELRDYENVPLSEDVWDYFEREVRPHVPEAWIDESKTDERDGEVGIVGYEIPFNRHFYVYQPPRPLEEINRDLHEVSREIQELLREVVE
jgi:type I restriction enzyme M protein